MRAVVQRAREARVTVERQVVGEIGPGLVVLLGVGQGDTPEAARYLAEKIINLRIFSDDAGKMNRSLLETGGSLLAVSQFTLYGDCRKGRRPAFDAAARPELARQLYEFFVAEVQRLGVPVATGQFQAHMEVALVNDGPVTMLIDTAKENPSDRWLS